MSKEYYVLRIHNPGSPNLKATIEFHAYEEAAAEKFALDSAKEHLGRLYEVVWRRSGYELPRNYIEQTPTRDQTAHVIVARGGTPEQEEEVKSYIFGPRSR